MSSLSRDAFLERIHRDASLQKRLLEPTAQEVAVAVARAAGLEIHPADLLAAQRNPSAAGERNLEVIDFDGDGVPDAMRVGGEWVLRTQED